MVSQNITARILMLVFIFMTEIYYADCYTNEVSDVNLKCPSFPLCYCCNDTATCNDNGQCGDQCKAGYFGGKCLNKCPDNCVLCTYHPDAASDSSYWSKGYCTRCKDGFYSTEDLYQCQSPCTEGCARCSSNTHCDGCKPGYFFSTGTCHKCMSSCVTCSSSISCTTCAEGYFLNGNICQPCILGCARCSSNNVCNQCKPGYYNSGTHCLACSMGCSNQCDNTTGTCICKAGYTGSSCDSCVSGWYYSTGTCHLCLSSCATCTSSIGCTSCAEGYFLNGNNCQLCSLGCARCSFDNHCEQCINGYFASNTGCAACSDGCSNDCDKTNGACQCRNGYTGNKCDKCISGWYISTSACHQCKSPCATCSSLYSCITCVDGYYLNGKNCQSCPAGCAKCSHDNDCDLCIMGYYSSGTGCVACSVGCSYNQCDVAYGSCPCKPGYDGDKCDRCAPKYQYFPDCDQCVAGYFGSFCDQNCPENCNQSACRKENGICIQGCVQHFMGDTCTDCVSGRFGPECSDICPDNCYGRCTRDAGYCQTCKPNFVGVKCDSCEVSKYGTYCNLNCSTACKYSCDNKTGYCDSCVHGYYGNTCQLKCSDQCLNETCDIETGKCDHGCISDYSGENCCLKGPNCKKCSPSMDCVECEVGFFGIKCVDNCSSNCAGRQCDRNTGKCDSCPNGYKGEFCQIYLSTSKHTTKREDNQVAVIIVIALAIIIVVLSTFILRKRITKGVQACRERLSAESFYVNEFQITQEVTKTNKKSIDSINRDIKKYQEKQAKHARKDVQYAEKVSRLQYELNEIKGGASNEDKGGGDASNYESLDGRWTGDHPYADL